MDDANDRPDDQSGELDHCRAALAASEARFRNVIEKNADGTVVVSRDGLVLYMNPAAERLFGCLAGDCVGTLFGVPVVPDEVTELDLPRCGPGAIAEMRVVETEWEGRPAYLASTRDVTARKRAEEAMKEADRRKDEFLAMLAHELRNPVATINYALRLLRPGDNADADAEAALDIAGRQVNHMSRLIDDLLDVSRITRGLVALRRETVDAAAAVGRVAKAAAPQAESHGLRLTVSPATAPLWVDADPTRLEQVFANLINNAIKYTPEGGRVEVAVEPDGGEVVVRVRDDGVGIAADMLPRVFDLFAQADRTLARSGGGLGIGLTVVRRLVEMHGGRITASSDGEGRGSEFVVRLPAVPAAVDSPGTDAPAEADGKAVRVLLVEDQVGLARMLATLLERRGHHVRVAHDGPTALAEAKTYRPQLVLLDIGLPGMDGYQVAERLRHEARLEDALVVALTGYGREEDRRRSLAAGCDRHVVKPISYAALNELFAEVVNAAPPAVP